MSTNSSQDVTKLSLDLKNFRTVPQKNESDAIKAMITIKPERFYAVMESLLDDGYIPTENIIVLKDGDELIVKEGNRRIAALKLIHGQYKVANFGIPDSITEKIKNLDVNWKKDNLSVPCTIYNKSEADKVQKVVDLTHGKGEKASRDPWNSVARARHNRDAKGISEPALDLLEKYLTLGNNINNQQKERWAGEYPVTVLLEAMREIYSRLDLSSSSELAKEYPKIKNRDGVEQLLLDIGLDNIGFKGIRDVDSDFALNYGFNPIVVQPSPTQGNSEKNTSANNSKKTNESASGTSTGKKASTKGSSSTAKKAHATNDPKHVASLLRKFTPKGNKRQKVVTLRDELKYIKINDTPIAFCFLLRSMFEISAKAYCSDHTLSTKKASKNNKPARDKTLVELLTEITKHLTNNNSNKEMVKALHGALTEIGKPTGVLSVTSMNQLVHHPDFSIQSNDICTLFNNVFPLLEAMN